VADDLYDETDDWREEDDRDSEPDDDDDGDWRDYGDDGWEPDPEDSAMARAYEDEAEHRETVHGGGECACRVPLRDYLRWRASTAVNRLWSIRNGLSCALRSPWTLRLGPAEFTVRLRADRACGACSGRGWFYTLDRSREDDRPPGYNGAALCGCGSAIGQLADSRRYLRSTRGEPPF
jgi:hypothetical protein